MVFGGRRSEVVPLITEAFGWDHGVFLGATAASETTAANIAAVGQLRRDPFAMKPFCGYNMADYFQNWFDMGDRLGAAAPRIFYVNWFRKGRDGRWLWPGFGENSRALKWMCERVEGKVGAQVTPIGLLPDEEGLDLNGLEIPREDLRELMDVDPESWRTDTKHQTPCRVRNHGKLPWNLLPREFPICPTIIVCAVPSNRHRLSNPPFTSIVAPVIYPASSEARKRTV